ncbi:MAG: helix-turn-helix domain-containing protein, partial [Ktedonobacterales bacterium]
MSDERDGRDARRPRLAPASGIAVGATASDAPDTAVARQERAFALYCQGQRIEAIAQTLGVTPRTIRGWLAGVRQQIALDARAGRGE